MSLLLSVFDSLDMVKNFYRRLRLQCRRALRYFVVLVFLFISLILLFILACISLEAIYVAWLLSLHWSLLSAMLYVFALNGILCLLCLLMLFYYRKKIRHCLQQLMMVRSSL